MCKKIILILVLCSLFSLKANPPSLISIGGGWWMGGGEHSDGLIQFEYKWGGYLWRCIRPEACLIIPEFKGAFLGLGIGIDLYITDHLVFSPNFMPGFYYQGGAKNLGYPLEFRSALELAWEFKNKLRIGSQFWHISNASLGSKNPGVNAWTLFVAFPL